MKYKLLASLGCMLCSTAAAATNLPLERLFQDPSLSGTLPKHVTFSPDGSQVTYLQGSASDSDRYDLWLMPVAGGEPIRLVDSTQLGADEALSDEEKARRERQRVFGQGIMDYSWSPDGTALLFPLGGDVYLYHVDTHTLQQLTHSDGYETDAKFSPQGHYVSYVREQNLYVMPLDGRPEIAITQDGGDTVKYGMAEFVAQEEMARMTGYWWSADEQHLALTRVDTSPVPEAIRNEIYADGIKQIAQRYPYAGANNVAIQLGVASVNIKPTIKWLNISNGKDGYLARVKWAPDSHRLSYQWQSRNQQDLTLAAYDIRNGEHQVLLEEHSNTWLNLNHDLYFMKNGKGYIWASERTGFKHLYYSSWSGYQVRSLTQGSWQVDELAAVDEENGWVYFTAREKTPLESQLYRVSLNGKEKPEQISTEPGFHQVTFASDQQHYLDTFSSDHQPPQISLHRADGKRQAWVYENALTSGHPLFPYLEQWTRPQYGTLQADDGQQLHYRLWQPETLQKNKKYPVIVLVYGGPGVQTVNNRWQHQIPFAQYLVQHGYLVFQLDNRGSAGRGKAFEDVIYHQLASHELSDQHQGITFLRSLPQVDAKRIGIYGHSYGGYMTLMSMFRSGDDYAAGVAGAPVTDWSLYDTHYTERYLGTPANNASGYQASSVLPYVEGLTGSLLIYHGMADDNVLFTHTTRVINALQQHGKLFELMAYPGAKHSLFGEQTRLHQYRTIVDFFDRKLGNH